MLASFEQALRQVVTFYFVKIYVYVVFFTSFFSHFSTVDAARINIWSSTMRLIINFKHSPHAIQLYI